MSEEAAFLEVLKSNPADDTARLVYADWLDEHGETLKAEYLRLLVSFAQQEDNLADAREHSVLLKTGKSLPAEWREASGSRFSLILEGWDDKLRAIKWVRELTVCPLGEAKTASENLPCILMSAVTFERAKSAIPRDQRAGKLALRITPHRA